VADSFPDDLIQLQRDWQQAPRDLTDLYARLPHRPEPMPDPYTDARGNQHDASVGWTDDDHAAVDKLLARQRELAEALATHEYWATLSGPDVPKARMALNHIDDEEPADA
jgi:phenylalanine-4-hydroxylase